jgi:hypothetical protein
MTFDVLLRGRVARFMMAVVDAESTETSRNCPSTETCRAFPTICGSDGQYERIRGGSYHNHLLRKFRDKLVHGYHASIDT